MKIEDDTAQDTYDDVMYGIGRAFASLNDAARYAYVDCGDHAEFDMCRVCRSIAAARDYCEILESIVKDKCGELTDEHRDY